MWLESVSFANTSINKCRILGSIIFIDIKNMLSDRQYKIKPYLLCSYVNIILE